MSDWKPAEVVVLESRVATLLDHFEKAGPVGRSVRRDLYHKLQREFDPHAGWEQPKQDETGGWK